jgi:hypothetical protein
VKLSITQDVKLVYRSLSLKKAIVKRAAPPQAGLPSEPATNIFRVKHSVDFKQDMVKLKFVLPPLAGGM